MLAEAELAEYLDEIRKEVCACCVERPPGGPPCAPLGKQCGVELHLPELIDAVHDVHSPLAEPYLEHNREAICRHCAYLHSSICPCPMDYLAVPLVQAVEAVDERRARHERERQVITSLLGTGPGAVKEVVEAFAEAAGRWTGCDWPTRFGRSRLDLNGYTAAEAKAEAAKTTNSDVREDWLFAAAWLVSIEGFAERAEVHALHAVEAAKENDWDKAVSHARRARALEFTSCRALRRDGRLTWGPFCKSAEEAAVRARGHVAGTEGIETGSPRLSTT